MASKKNKRILKKEGAYTIALAYLDDRGLPRCPICNSLITTSTISYREVAKGDESYIEFLKYCPNENCHTKVKYYAQITVDETKRFDFADDVVEIKEEDYEL